MSEWTHRIGDTLLARDAEALETTCLLIQVVLVDGLPHLILAPKDGGCSFVRTAAEVERRPSEKDAVAT